MPNPRANRPLTLDQVTADLKSLSQPAQALFDMMAGGLRGSAVGTFGAPGDIETLARMGVNAAGGSFNPAMPSRSGRAFQPVSEEPYFPSSEELAKRFPPTIPNGDPMRRKSAEPFEEIGQFAPLPLSGKALKVLPYALGRGTGEVTKEAAHAINDAMVYQTGPLSQGPLSMLAPKGAVSHVVKPKGGNWLNGDVERAVKPLKSRSHEVDAQTLEELGIPRSPQDAAIDKWVDSNLTNYIKKEMATPEDPVRRLAEEGITHKSDLGDYRTTPGGTMMELRKEAGFPAEGMAQSDLAKAWENLSEISFMSRPAKNVSDKRYPWIAKLDPETPVYGGVKSDIANRLSFDHIVDVLKEDLATGRIRPEQLSKVSMEQAVRRTAEYDQEMARKMAEAQIRATEGMPVHKEYPDEGYKWIELALPEIKEMPSTHQIEPYESKLLGTMYRPVNKETLMHGEGYKTEEQATKEFLREHAKEKLEEALKYEGNTMGHCVGGYCPDVVEGRSRIYSLRDKRGEPHVTVEVGQDGLREQFFKLPQKEKERINSTYKGWESKLGREPTPEEHDSQLYKIMSEMGYAPTEKITQIKGKQNAKPKEEYLPFVQDFVKGGKWSDVGDLQNTGLHKLGSEYLTLPEAEVRYKPKVQEALSFLDTHPILEEHRIADKAYQNFSGNIPSPEYEQMQRGAGKPISENVPYTIRELRALLSSPEDWVERNETIYRPISTALEKINQAKKELGIADLPPEGMKRGGSVHISDNPDTMMMELGDKHMKDGGAEDDTKAFIGYPNLAKQARYARAIAPERGDVNLLKDPQTYAFLMGALGEAPDELGFTALDSEEQKQKIKAAGEKGFMVGAATEMGPLAQLGKKAGKKVLNLVGEGMNERMMSGRSLTPFINTPAPAMFAVPPGKPGLVVSKLIDEEPDIAKRLGAEARAKRQAAIEAEGQRKELAAQTQPSVGYRPSTPQKPDPLVGTRFVNEPAYGLNPNEPFDISKFKGGSGLVLPWDSQSRNVKTTQVSGMDLPNQIFDVTHGGIPYAFDTAHVNKGVAGASGLDIAKRVKTRADTAVKEGVGRGGTGELLHFPITMGFRAEDYALPYSEFSFDIINHKLMTGELTQKEADELTKMVRNFEPPKYKGKKPFENFAGFTSPEGLDQIYTGQGLKVPSGELRKAIADRIIWQKGSQEKLGFNAEDLMNATTYEPLRGVDKGYIGSTVMRNSPGGMRLSPSTGKYPYDTDFSGEHLGRLDDLVDAEALFYRTLNPIKRELITRENLKPYNKESLRNAAIGAIEKRNEAVSQPIDQQFLDDYADYLNELKKPHEYRNGGAITVKPKQDGQKFKPGKKPDVVITKKPEDKVMNSNQLSITTDPYATPMMAGGGEAKLIDHRRIEDMIAEPTMMEKATRMAQDLGQRGLDSVFPLRKVVRTGAEPMMEDFYYKSVMGDPETSLQNQNITSNQANTALFHIKNAVRNKLGMSRFPNKAEINTDDMIHNSFPDKESQRKAGGGAINADDLILEERPL